MQNMSHKKVSATKKTLAKLIWSKPLMAINSGAKKASFLELFFDISVIASVGVVAHLCGQFYTVGPIGWLYWICSFYVIFSLWVSLTTHLNKFFSIGIKFRIILFTMMIPVALITIGVVQTSTWYLSEGVFQISPLFFLGYGISRLIIASLFFEVWLFNRKRKHSREAIKIHLIPSIIYTVISLLSLSMMFFSWEKQDHNLLMGINIATGVSLLVEFIVDSYKLSATNRVSSLNKDHLNERFTLFIIIALGEGMMSAGMSISNDITLQIPLHKNLSLVIAQSTFRIVSCLLLLFLIWWAYIDKVPNFKIKTNSRWQVIMYVYLNFFIIVGIMLISFWYYSETVSLNSIISQNKWTPEQLAALQKANEQVKHSKDILTNVIGGDRYKRYPASSQDITALGQIGFGFVFLGIGGIQLISNWPFHKNHTPVSSTLWYSSVVTLLTAGTYGVAMGAVVQNIKSVHEQLKHWLIWINIGISLVCVIYGIVLWIKGVLNEKESMEKEGMI